MPVELDPAQARPLTSREISKVLCSILAGVVVTDPDARPAIPHVVWALRRGIHVGEVAATAHRFREDHRIGDPQSAEASWATALSATVTGFRGWCTHGAVNTALAWVAENLHEICPPSDVAPSH